MPKIELIQGDCLEEMSSIPDGSVDMVLTDPPYGTTACKWDSIIPLEPMWAQLKRVIKPNGAIVLFGSEPFSSALRISNIKNYKYDWIWDKHIPRNFANAKRMPMNKHENISVFNCKGHYYPQMVKRDKPVKVKNYAKKGKDSNYKINTDGVIDKVYTYTHKNPDTIIVGKWQANGGKVHPNQKPVALMEYLIKTYTNEGETVLDFTMGSGTTGVACKNLNRNFIGIELDPEYFKIAEKRINENL
ncbi:MAG TPA: site-specific DNA-methyltransferase [Desulfatiglandales bacterium]|nr:site-specific DNA-methyltransferase [Desulfatiglandales bacterium]